MYGSYFGQSSFASHALAYESNVVVVGEEIDLGVAAPLGCGVQTGAGTVLNVLAPPPEASLVVFGAGGVGLSAVMAASASGVGTIDRRRSGRRAAGSSRRSSARRATIDPAGDDVVDEIRRLTGAGATHAIDTTAKGAVINQAIEALAPLGTLALVGDPRARVRAERPERDERRQDRPRGDRGRRGAAASSSRAWSRSTTMAGCRSRS